MEIIPGGLYKDRQGTVWRIALMPESNPNRRRWPLVGERWEGKRYHTRVFLRDGTWEANREDPWDLVEQVSSFGN